MEHQINIFILLFGAVQGILLSILLLRKRTFRKAYCFLAVYILALIAQIVIKVINKNWMIDHSEPLYALSYHLPLLYGPLAYLLSKQVIQPGIKLPFKTLFHFVPFISLWILEEIGLLASAQVYLLFVFEIASVNVYHWLAFQLWNRSGGHEKRSSQPISFLQLNWIRNFVKISWVVALLIISANFLLYIISPGWVDARWAFLALTIFIYWISASALQTPEVFTVIKGDGKNGTGINSSNFLQLNKHIKYQGSGLTTEEAARIRQVLKILMVEKKPYLDPVITLNGLAKLIPCQRHYLSQVLNDSIGLSFNDFINQYRIEEAKTLLSDPKNNHLKMIVIAEESGFNSISSFNELFKKYNRLTPTQFRSKVQSDSQEQSAQGS